MGKRKKKKASRYICYFDGACDKNPSGSIGMGAVVMENGIVQAELMSSDFMDEGNSNNVAESKALIMLLEYLLENLPEGYGVEIYGDSKLVCNQTRGRWRILSGRHVEYAEYAKELYFKLRGRSKFANISWIPRENNTHADKLSKIALEDIVEEQLYKASCSMGFAEYL